MRKRYINLLLFTCVFQFCHPGYKHKVKDHLANADTVFQDAPDSALIAFSSILSLPVNDLLCQSWELTDVDQPHWNEFLWDKKTDSKAYPSLNLFPDSRFTENIRLSIRMGRWSLNKKTRQIRLAYNDGAHKSYFVEKLSFGQMTAVPDNLKDTAHLSFSASQVIHKDIIDDPFYPDNNTWRIKPVIAESREQIRARLKACVHFYYLFFKDNSQRRATNISFIGLPQCFVWYDGGIGLESLLEVDEKWKKCFYSDDQADIAYGMLNDILNRHQLTWPPHSKGWIFQTYTVLGQIYAQL